MSSTCCGGNCGCGASCKCGSGCGGCKMYPDMIGEKTSSESLVVGLAPQMAYVGENEMAAAENGGCNCKCGDNCTCNPCNCNMDSL